MTTTLEQTLTPAQETALDHMRARYPDQLNRYTDPLLAATQALILTTHDLTKAPTLVDRTTLDHAMRLIHMARHGALLAELLTLTTSHARGDTYQHIAAHRGYSGPTQAHQRIKRLRYLLDLREIDTPRPGPPQPHTPPTHPGRPHSPTPSHPQRRRQPHPQHPPHTGDTACSPVNSPPSHPRHAASSTP